MASFREQSDAFIREFSIPIAQKTGLTHLPDYAPTIAYSTLGYTILHLVLAPAFSKAVFPVTYKSLKGRKGRNNW